MLWESCISPPADSVHLPALRRISFVTETSPEMLQTAIAYATKSSQLLEQARGRLLVVLGRSRMISSDAIKAEVTARLEKLGSSSSSGELRRTIGDPATAIVSSRVKADLLVVQASKHQVISEEI
jgi:hypothetical protein